VSAEFTAHLRDLFAPFARIDVRAMFGGYGLYRDGTIFAIAIDDAVYLKVDAETRARFEAAGSAPFVYTGSAKPITMSYWSAPADAVDSPMDMLPWARLAYEAALRKPKGKVRKKAKSVRS
jgi:DNA transformation protein and related proteins